METENAQVEVVEEPVAETKVETEPVKKSTEERIDELYNTAVKTITASSGNRDFAKTVQKLKTVVRCNGEANLNLNNISGRYDCDLETFVNSVFALISSEGYVIFTTYNNGKPVYSLGESM